MLGKQLRTVAGYSLTVDFPVRVILHFVHHLNQFARMHTDVGLKRPELPRQPAGICVQLDRYPTRCIYLGVFGQRIRLQQIVEPVTSQIFS